jgi:hypothetical protein
MLIITPISFLCPSYSPQKIQPAWKKGPESKKLHKKRSQGKKLFTKCFFQKECWLRVGAKWGLDKKTWKDLHR